MLTAAMLALACFAVTQDVSQDTAGDEPQNAPEIWLVDHQDDDGKWDADGFAKHDAEGRDAGMPGEPGADVAVTSLALLTFLGDGSTPAVGPHRERVARALDWLSEQMDPESGRLGAPDGPRVMRQHALATLALTEAAYFTEDRKLAARSGAALLALRQAVRADGGWSADGEGDTASDALTTGWAALAFASALDAELIEDRSAFERALAWFAARTDAKTGAVVDEGVDPASSAARKTTAMALLCRVLGKQRPDAHPELGLAVESLIGAVPVWNASGAGMDPELWYLTSLATFQLGGSAWKRWNKALKPFVQDMARATAGGPAPVDTSLVPEGSVAASCYASLTLMVFYRYARLVGAR